MDTMMRRQEIGETRMDTWWIPSVRGGLGILLGLVVLLTPEVGLGELVVLFGSYALLDGVCAVGWAFRASRRLLEGWPVVLEGALSLAVGVVALGFPFEAAGVVHVLAPWGVVIGILEILAALRLRQGLTGHWALLAAGAWSIFLALLVLRVPHAVTDSLVNAVGVYALTFGVLVSMATVLTRLGGPRVVPWSGEHARRSAMRLHLAVILGIALAFSPFDGTAQEKQIVDVKELAGIWQGRATREQEQTRVMMIVAADGSYRAMTTGEASTEGKFYLQDGQLHYRSSRTLGTALVSEDQGHTLLTMTPDELNYRAGRAEYERVK